LTDAAYSQKLNELAHLLNGPNVSIQPMLVWHLLGEIAKHEVDIVRLKDSVIDVTTSDSIESLRKYKDESAVGLKPYRVR
jgi:hypothetical protein